MDIISHAIAGASAGYYFGNPVLGAVIGILPDLPLIGRRKTNPTELYKFTHSALFLVVCCAIAYSLGCLPIVFCALLSHLLLDLPTHGAVWFPRVFWPIEVNIYRAYEWEFFNKSWWMGLLVLIIWSSAWLVFAQ